MEEGAEEEVRSRERFENTMSLALKKDGSMSRGMQKASGNQKIPEKWIVPWRLQKECSPADSLVLAQGNPFWNSDLQTYQIINLCGFKPLSL